MAQPQVHCADFSHAPYAHLGGARCVLIGEPPSAPIEFVVAADGRLEGPVLSAPVGVSPGDGLLATDAGLQWVAEPTRGRVVGWRIAGEVQWTLGERIELSP